MGKVKPIDKHQPTRPATISRAAAAAGLTAKAVRLYETRGLLAAPTRTAAGYRLYAEDDIARLRFIAAVRRLGLHIDQIAEILGSARDGQRPCTTTRAILDQRIGEIDQLIARLTELRTTLSTARDTTDHASTGAVICPVIEQSPTTPTQTRGRSSLAHPATAGATSRRADSSQRRNELCSHDAPDLVVDHQRASIAPTRALSVRRSCLGR